MTNSPFSKSEIAQGLLNLAPPLISESLLEDDQFCDEFGLNVTPILTFEDSGNSFQRAELYQAIRKFLSGASDVAVNDIKEREWQVKKTGEVDHLPLLSITHGKRQIQLNNFFVLAQKDTVRLRFLELVGSDLNLPRTAHKNWRKILCERPLLDEEVDEFHSDLSDTPENAGRLIRDELGGETVSLSTLVPHSKRYYERLVGAYDGSTSLKDYASGKGKRFIKRLISWKPFDGFLYSLLLSSHSALTSEISVELLEKEDVVRALDYLEKRGDRISQLGAIEVVLRVLPDSPEIEHFIVRLIKQIRDENVNGTESRFNLHSTLFYLVDGELSRTRLFSEFPPFYRRLASLSQSALISRRFVELGVNIDSFCEWAVKKCGMHYIHFHLQSLVDMRLEPRWIPEFASASRMRADSLGRIMDTAWSCRESLRSTELYDLILGTGTDSLQSNIEFPHTLTVGPLAGGDNVTDASTPSIFEEIENQFRTEAKNSPPFVPLILFGPLLPCESNLPGLAADALKRGDHRLDDFSDNLQRLTVQTGLASVAAVTRSRSLGDELRILASKNRRDTQHALSAGEAVRVCLAAAASRSDLQNWREYVGGWLTELAFGKLEDSDRNALHGQLRYLCHVDPGLWAFCSRADAALKAIRSY